MGGPRGSRIQAVARHTSLVVNDGKGSLGRMGGREGGRGERGSEGKLQSPSRLMCATSRARREKGWWGRGVHPKPSPPAALSPPPRSPCQPLYYPRILIFTPGALPPHFPLPTCFLTPITPRMTVGTILPPPMFLDPNIIPFSPSTIPSLPVLLLLPATLFSCSSSTPPHYIAFSSPALLFPTRPCFLTPIITRSTPSAVPSPPAVG